MKKQKKSVKKAGKKSKVLLTPKVKLSEAIRRGAKEDGKQVFGSLFRLDPKGKISGVCALGGAVYHLLPKDKRRATEVDFHLEGLASTLGNSLRSQIQAAIKGVLDTEGVKDATQEFFTDELRKVYPELNKRIEIHKLDQKVYKALGYKSSELYEGKYTVGPDGHQYYDPTGGGPRKKELESIITTLNDKAKWSREKIADVVKSLGY